MKKASQIPLNLGYSTELQKKSINQVLQWKIVQIMMFHVGIEHKISRQELVNQLHVAGFQQDERTVRMAISEMRLNLGIPIAGTGGRNGGYWILKDQAEKDAYCKVELHDRGMSLLQQESAINKAASDWYLNGQLRLPAGRGE